MTIDLELFEKTPLTREPFEHLVVPEFVKAEARNAINDDYPKVQRPGSFPERDDVRAKLQGPRRDWTGAREGSWIAYSHRIPIPTLDVTQSPATCGSHRSSAWTMHLPIRESIYL